jgi:hypothetical protein
MNTRFVAELKGYGSVGCRVGLGFDPVSLRGDRRRRDRKRVRYRDRR